mgnify:FL=1
MVWTLSWYCYFPEWWNRKDFMSQVHEVYDDASRELCGVTKKTYRGMLLKIILLFTGLTSNGLADLIYFSQIVTYQVFQIIDNTQWMIFKCFTM